QMSRRRFPQFSPLQEKYRRHERLASSLCVRIVFSPPRNKLPPQCCSRGSLSANYPLRYIALPDVRLIQESPCFAEKKYGKVGLDHLVVELLRARNCHICA